MTVPQPQQPILITVGKRSLTQPEAQKVVPSAAGWFLWIAALSLLNSFAAMTNLKYGMALGLGITQILDVLMLHLDKVPEGSNHALILRPGHLAIVGVICAAFYVIGQLARKGNNAAFLPGIIVYAIDSLIFLALKDVIGIALHGFALFMIWLLGRLIAAPLRAVTGVAERVTAGVAKSPVRAAAVDGATEDPPPKSAAESR